MTNDTCSGLPIDSNFYYPSDLLYDMLFTTLGNKLPSINDVIATNVSINDSIIIKGKIILIFLNRKYIHFKIKVWDLAVHLA